MGSGIFVLLDLWFDLILLRIGLLAPEINVVVVVDVCVVLGVWKAKEVVVIHTCRGERRQSLGK